jgi:hypothetical protein
MSVIRISDDIVYREVDGSIVTLSLTSGEYVGLDAIGSHIWRLIEQDGQKESIRRGLLAEFDLGDKECDEELDAFLSMLTAKKLVAIDASGLTA